MDTGTSAAPTMSMTELHEQQWFNLLYEIMQNLLQQLYTQIVFSKNVKLLKKGKLHPNIN